jgi:predicted TIM-barrel fold metal-dependent hydrolase
MPAQTIVDMRVRPPAAGFDQLALYWDKPRIERMTRDLGFEPPPSYSNGSLSECIAEMEEAGVRLGVITGRSSGARMGRVDNDAIAGVVERNPGRFIGYAGVDIADVPAARVQLRKVIEEKKFRGVVIESGCADVPLYAEDESLRPLFGDCEDAKMPVLLMAGGNAGPDLTYSHPVQIDRLAARHPKLQIVSAHGSWPWVTEVLGVAYRRTNVWLSPDMYMFLPGWQMYLEAANSYLQDRFLFGTAYPALPFKETVDRFLRMPLLPKVGRQGDACERRTPAGNAGLRPARRLICHLTCRLRAVSPAASRWAPLRHAHLLRRGRNLPRFLPDDLNDAAGRRSQRPMRGDGHHQRARDARLGDPARRHMTRAARFEDRVQRQHRMPQPARHQPDDRRRGVDLERHVERESVAQRMRFENQPQAVRLSPAGSAAARPGAMPAPCPRVSTPRPSVRRASGPARGWSRSWCG